MTTSVPILAVQRGDGAFPVGDLLHLVDDHDPRLAPPRGGLDVVDEIAGRPHRFERERLLVDVDHLPFVAQRGRELPQEDALADPPDAGHRGDGGGVEKLAEAVKVVVASDLHSSNTDEPTASRLIISIIDEICRSSAGSRRRSLREPTSAPATGSNRRRTCVSVCPGTSRYREVMRCAPCNNHSQALCISTPAGGSAGRPSCVNVSSRRRARGNSLPAAASARHSRFAVSASERSAQTWISSVSPVASRARKSTS